MTMTDDEKYLFNLRGNTIDNLIHRVDTLLEQREQQAETIRKLNREMDNLVIRLEEQHDLVASYRNAFEGLRRVLRRIMSQIAIQTMLHKTHRERNEENRAILADMKYWHDKEPSTFGHNAEIDDIPF